MDFPLFRANLTLSSGAVNYSDHIPAEVCIFADTRTDSIPPRRKFISSSYFKITFTRTSQYAVEIYKQRLSWNATKTGEE